MKQSEIKQIYERLTRSSVGCCIEGYFTNHLFYADDLILMASSLAVLQKLLDVCDEYAAEHEITYNCEKTQNVCT